MAILKPTLLTALAAIAATTQAQSANPGVGSNPKAQGATDDVTPSTGPNGYLHPLPLSPPTLGSPLTTPQLRRLAKHRHHQHRLDTPLPRPLGRPPHPPLPILQHHRLSLRPIRPILPIRQLKVLHRPGYPRRNRHARILLQRLRRRSNTRPDAGLLRQLPEWGMHGFNPG